MPSSLMQAAQNEYCHLAPSGKYRYQREQVGRKLGKCILSQALEIARTHRWVAEWLFPGEGGGQHPPLAPEVFDRALGVHMKHTLSANNFGTPCDGPLHSDAPRVVMNKDLNQLIVPVAIADSVTVGYTFCTGHQYTKLTGYAPVTTAQGRHYIMSRFAYDMRARQFLVFSPQIASGVSALIQMLFHCDGSCERNFIVVPMIHYTADLLPSVVISSQCNLETRDLSSKPTFQYEEEEPPTASPPDSVPILDDSMDDLFRDLNSFSSPVDNTPLPFGAADPDLDPFLEEVSFPDVSNALVPHSSPPPTRWSLDADGSTDDGVGVPRKPGNADTSAGLFDMSAMMASLAKLERNMKGHFFALRAKKDIMDPDTGELLSRQTGHQISLIESLTAAESARLRQTAAQHYYSTALSPTIDASLISTINQSAAQRVILPPPPSSASVSPNFMDGFVPQMSMSPVLSRSDSPAVSATATRSMNGGGKLSHQLAPRPMPVSDNKPVDVPVALSALSPVDKAEQKKIRNRLSAAKSNQRRRAQIEAQKRELVTLHLRVEELKKKKQQMLAENEVLRAQFFGAELA